MLNKDKRVRKNVPHFDIFDYWKDKVILSNGEIVNGRDRPQEGYEWVVEDNGEPCCWGCGLPVITKLEETKQHGFDIDDLPIIWNDDNVKRTLNKCHIVPHAKGGEDIPKNLFLLCESCHIESPDTTNPHSFIRWVYDKRQRYSMGTLSLKSANELLQKEIDRRGLNTTPAEIMVKICEMNPHFNTDSLQQYLDEHIESHGFKVGINSLVCGYVDWMISIYIDLVLEQ